MKRLKLFRPVGVDPGPKMTLEDAADRCGVEAGWLRLFVVTKGVRPLAAYANPTRRYYSLLAIRAALRKESHGAPQ